MGRKTPVPITPEVLDWAIKESGYSYNEVADRLNIPKDELESWVEGKDLPGLTKTKELSQVLKRTITTLLLPAPPDLPSYSVQFRASTKSSLRTPTPKEKLFLRETFRLQQIISWILTELDYKEIDLPRYRITDDPESVAIEIREKLGISFRQQLKWQSDSEALNVWRDRLENNGFLVFLISLGEESSRGFSIWDNNAPLIAANTFWNNKARIFTMLHELGHLLTRSNSICKDASSIYQTHHPTDEVERWCETLAASILIPWHDLTLYLKQSIGWYEGSNIADLNIVQELSRDLNVSMKALALRFIKKGISNWELFNQIPHKADFKSQGGGGGRTTLQLKLDKFGNRAVKLFIEAINNDILTTSDLIEYLDITYDDIDKLQEKGEDIK